VLKKLAAGEPQLALLPTQAVSKIGQASLSTHTIMSNNKQVKGRKAKQSEPAGPTPKQDH
jgi:hypothetical protein